MSGTLGLPEDAGPRAEALARGLLLPLVTGGELTLERPFGARLALALGQALPVVDEATRLALRTARITALRRLAPLDEVAEPQPEDWALAAALHDLLQATNPELTSPLTRDRPARLVRSVVSVTSRVPHPPTLTVALARHSLFAGIARLGRIDTTVRWWSGEERCIGAAPPARLLALPELRKVRVEAERVQVPNMATLLPDEEGAWTAALAAWLTRSPLTDVAWASRTSPRFRWSEASLALIAAPLGAALATRAVTLTAKAGAPPSGLAALSAATEELSGAPRRLAADFGARLARAVDTTPA
ncbi:MAG: hypothetical protein FJ096_01785 [Deltaproteobacteria bacterium]|nr:hypothetical protein [Deltaproteobacteria bacterium]